MIAKSSCTSRRYGGQILADQRIRHVTKLKLDMTRSVEHTLKLKKPAPGLPHILAVPQKPGCKRYSTALVRICEIFSK